ncbi:MAG: extracellular solute-binding protein [Candidatus Doudnabacteria bacterium]|nr:extracellular solute-binding protein [Candidatus Doudnabacteria bacterium]
MTKKYYIIGGVILLLLIIMGVLLVLGTGNKPKPHGEVNLTWWKTFETSDNVQQLISDYEQAHKNVHINYVKKDINTYEQDLLNAYASGTAPDVVSIHNDWLPKQMDKLSPMPDGLMSLRTYKDSYLDVAAADFTKDDKVYAMPMNVDVLALYWNKDMLGSSGYSAPPKTWQELAAKDMIPKLTKVSKPGSFLRSGIALGTASNINRAVDVLALIMLQNGTQFYSSDFTAAAFDQQPAEATENSDCTTLGCLALDYYTQFANPARKVYTWNSKSDNSVDAFTQGKVAMMFSYYYMTPQIKDKGPTLNWGVAPVPQVSVDSLNKVNFANYWGEAVSKSSPNADVAWDFLKFITSKDELKKYYSAHKLVASRKDIINEQIGDPDIGVYAESALTAKSIYKKDAAGFEQAFSQMIDDVSARGLTPGEALGNGVQQINFQLQNQ